MKYQQQLQHLVQELAKYARSFGLDFYETRFELVDFRQMNELASYGGFTGRYPHWRFGMGYEHFTKSYTYGFHKIYEMVINNDPCYAYIMEGNTLVDMKLVIAHVYGHCDFFKNNLWFEKTNRKMIDEMANHGARVRRYAERFGYNEVEKFFDVCLSLENLIDFHSLFIKRHEKEKKESEMREPVEVIRFKSKKYLEPYINPEEEIEKERKEIEIKRKEGKKFPEEPERDILMFLVENASIPTWQRDILSIVQEEAYYFAPQKQTQIMNEGWASYWHSKILTVKALSDAEIIDFADHHSSTMAMSTGRLNPYKLGLDLFRDIEDRWNRGKFGKEYEECENMREKQTWDRNLGLGQKKIFEVRKIYNDVMFIDTFLTEEFCRNNKLFTYDFNPKAGVWEISSRDFKNIKEKLLFSLTNFGEPIICIEDGNFLNRGELLLKHYHEGFDLRKDWAVDTLKNIQIIWKRPVNIQTIFNEKPVLWTHDGNNFGEKEL